MAGTSKGLSSHRWIIGGRLVYVVNQLAQILAGDSAAIQVPDNAFHGLIAVFKVLLDWDGVRLDHEGTIHLSIAQARLQACCAQSP